MSFWSDPIGNIENAVSNPVQAIKNLAPTIGQIGAIGSAVMQGGTNPMADLAAFNATAGLLGGSSSSPSATIPTANTTGGTASPSGLSTLNQTGASKQTPGLTKANPISINPYGATFSAPTASNDYMAQGGLVNHYAGGGDVMPPSGGIFHGSTRVSLTPPVPHSYLSNAPHFADGGHVPEFYSEGGMHNRFVKGAGDGTSDDVPAMLANGEFVIPADVVSALGNGSNDSGAKVLDHFLETIRAHKKAHDPKQLPPDSKGALAYISEAHKKVKA